MKLAELRDLYAQTLLDDVIPFWERHGLSHGNGIATCLREDGTLVSEQRWCWSQWRAVWVFSRLYNHVRPEPRWLEAAHSICDFLRKTDRAEEGHWPVMVLPDHSIQRGYESLFTDGFAIYGLVELWKATEEHELLDLALETQEAVERTLALPELPPLHPYPPAPDRMAISHGVSMIFSLVYHELAKATGDQAIREKSQMHHRQVMDTFLRSERGLVLEWLAPDGSEYPPPGGTVCLPGHAIESMWFQIHIARDDKDESIQHRAVQAIRNSLEAGWDVQYGGLFLAIDADGRTDVAWPYADHKIWWPHTEALYATLLAYELTREPWCLDWHERLRTYCYAHYPVETHGEWRQKLDRQGNPVDEIVALPVKDPFHLPRNLMLCVEVLDRMLAK